MLHEPMPQPPTPALIAEAREALADRDPALAVAHAASPVFEWRLRPRGFAALLRLVVEQQVSVAAAAAIWGRLEASLGTVTPQGVLALGEAALHPFGLSRGKARYAAAMAQAEVDGRISLETLHLLDDDAATASLLQLKGVGRWTAQTYLMFCEGRLDAFPAGDVALQHGLRLALGGELKPSEGELEARAEAWRPWRGIAAHLLWAYYSAVRRGDVIAPL